MDELTCRSFDGSTDKEPSKSNVSIKSLPFSQTIDSQNLQISLSRISTVGLVIN